MYYSQSSNLIIYRGVGGLNELRNVNKKGGV